MGYAALEADRLRIGSGNHKHVIIRIYTLSTVQYKNDQMVLLILVVRYSYLNG